MIARDHICLETSGRAAPGEGLLLGLILLLRRP